MDTLNSFEKYIEGYVAEISLLWFVLSIILAGTFGYLLQLIYVKYGNTLSNRNQFGKIFPLMAMTTLLVITIVKSSLALSLGLVGALSIIRFRAAIKEPEELVYLFITIGIGLGFGANQGIITSAAFLIIILLIIFSKKTAILNPQSNDLNLTIISNSSQNLNFDDISSILEKYCLKVEMKRLDQSKDKFEASFMVEYTDKNSMINCKNDILKLDDSISCKFLDNKRIFY